MVHEDDGTLSKWPRQYAAEIIMMKKREDRIAALADVPERLRPLVEKHVRINFERAGIK